MSYINDCQLKFNSLPPEILDKVKSGPVASVIKKIEEQYNIDLSFLVTLVMIDELALRDIPEYLMKKYRIGDEESIDLKDELVDQVFKPIFISDEFNGLSAEDKIKTIFQKEIIFTLQGDDEIKRDVNSIITNLLLYSVTINNDDLVKILLANQEQLTAKQFVLDQKSTSPTVANWLNDFLRYVGTKPFSNVEIMQYVTSSSNAKILNEGEKRLVIKLLHLFCNLKFFPETINPEAPVWEIFPIEKEATKTFESPLPRGMVREPATAKQPFVPLAIKEKLEAKGLPQDIKEKLVRAYFGQKARQEAISDEENIVLSKSQGQVENTKNLFFEAVKTNNFIRIIAGLFILARADKIFSLLKEDKRARQIIEQEIFPKIIFEAKKKWPEADLGKFNFNFENDAENPAYTQLFIKYLLNKSTRGDTNESARIGMQLASILSSSGHKEFLGMTFYDETKEKFDWKQLEVDNQGNFSI